jgi:hypothetical protein
MKLFFGIGLVSLIIIGAIFLVEEKANKYDLYE